MTTQAWEQSDVNPQDQAHELSERQHHDVCEHTDQLWREGKQAHTAIVSDHRSLSDQWKTAARRLAGDHWDVVLPAAIKPIVINKIRNIVETHVAAQVEQPPKLRLKPVDSIDKKRYALKEAGARKLSRIMASAQVQGFTPDQLTGKAEISIDQFEALTTPTPPEAPEAPEVPLGAGMPGAIPGAIPGAGAIQQGMGFAPQTAGPQAPGVPGAILGMTVQEGILDQEDIWVIDDKLKTEVAQRRFDRMWASALGESYFTMACWFAAANGHQAMLVEFDPDNQKLIFRLPPPDNVVVDPDALNLDEAGYLQYGCLVPAVKLVASYPNSKEAIARIASEGSSSGGAASDLSDLYNRIDWQRKMVLVRHTWERYVDFPMTQDQAIDTGKVILKPWDITEALTAGILQSAPGTPAPGITPGTPGNPATLDLGQGTLDPTSPDGSSLLVLTDLGQATSPGQPNWPHRMVRADTGEDTSPGEPNWPTVQGILHTVTMPDAEHVLERVQCAYLDMPWGWFRNGLIDHGMYAIGTPAHLDGTQQFINSLGTYIRTIISYGAIPMELIPSELMDYWESLGIQPGMEPGKIVAVPPELRAILQDYKNGFAVPGPKVPEGLYQMFQAAIQLIDDLGQNAAVMQGKLHAGASGALADRLTSNARGPLELRSLFAQEGLMRVCKIALHAMIKFWPVDGSEDDTLGPYPPVVMDILNTEIAKIHWDIDVELVNARGATRERNQQETIAKYQVGLLTKRTALERLDEDPDLEQRREKEAAAAQPQTTAIPQ